tara:strand:+ start:119 stop:466 length:348 start_codon:yes stop_codon:yes gene_type:complete
MIKKHKLVATIINLGNSIMARMEDDILNEIKKCLKTTTQIKTTTKIIFTSLHLEEKHLNLFRMSLKSLIKQNKITCSDPELGFSIKYLRDPKSNEIINKAHWHDVRAYIELKYNS